MALSAEKMKNLVGGSRPGSDPGISAAAPAKQAEKEKAALKGLVLSEIQFKPLDWFKHNPDNQLFRQCKTGEYFKALKKDISEANAILNPLIAMPDGLIVEGESRHILGKELYDSGKAAFAKLPVRIILSAVPKKKIKERLYLGNLSRFDVPPSVKLLAYAEIWPGYFLAKSDGREGKEITTKKEIAAATGLSESQIKRNKGVIQKAAEIAHNEEAPLSEKHIQQAQAGGKKKQSSDPKEFEFHSYSPPGAFLKAAVTLLFEKKEYTAIHLLINHFLRKKDRGQFIAALPAKIKEYLSPESDNP
jgi:hypothetical protein